MFVLPLSLAALTMVAPTADQPPAAPDYDLGLVIGRLISQGCVAFGGEITGVGQSRPAAENKELRLQPFELKVKTTLFGKSPAAGGTVELTAAEHPGMIKSPDELWRVWQHVPVARGVQLVVFRWPEGAGGELWGVQRTVAGVFASAHDIERVRKIADWNDRHDGSASRLAAAIAAIDGRVDFSDPLYAGYVVGRLLGQEKLERNERDTVVRALALLLGNDRIEASDRTSLSARLSGDYGFTTAATQAVAVKALVQAAAGEGRVAQDAVFRLGEISKTHKLDLKPFLTADLKKKLLATYRAAIAPRPGGFKGYPEAAELAAQLEKD